MKKTSQKQALCDPSTLFGQIHSDLKRLARAQFYVQESFDVLISELLKVQGSADPLKFKLFQ